MTTATETSTAPTSRTAAIKLLRDGDHIDQIDMSKLDRPARDAVREAWRGIRKARLDAMGKDEAKAYREAERARALAKRAARGERPSANTVRIDKDFLKGLAAGIDQAVSFLGTDKQIVVKVGDVKSKMAPGAYLSRIAAALRATTEKAAAAKDSVYFVVKVTTADGSMSAYGERFNTQKRAQKKADSLAKFLADAGVSGYEFRALSLAEARTAGVTDLAEDAPEDMGEKAAA